MEEAMTNADLIVRTLREAGITHGFGVPSGNVLPLLEAMRSGGLPFVLTAHEGSAAFAADAMGRLGAPPGRCGPAPGPGGAHRPARGRGRAPAGRAASGRGHRRLRDASPDPGPAPRGRRAPSAALRVDHDG